MAEEDEAADRQVIAWQARALAGSCLDELRRILSQAGAGVTHADQSIEGLIQRLNSFAMRLDACAGQMRAAAQVLARLLEERDD